MPSDEDRDALIEEMLNRQHPESPLSSGEIRKMRKMLDEYEKAAWLKKKIFVMVPWLATAVTAGGALIAWLWNGGGGK
jgi:hypothetical protein